MSTAPPPGWHPDPSDPHGSMRWWDGARWTHHTQVQGMGGPRDSQAGWTQAGYQPSRRAMGGNANSMMAIVVSAIYVYVALETSFFFFGILPVMATIRAFQRRERFAPLAAAATAIVMIVSLSHLRGR